MMIEIWKVIRGTEMCGDGFWYFQEFPILPNNDFYDAFQKAEPIPWMENVLESGLENVKLRVHVEKQHRVVDI